MENDPRHPRACICAECEKHRIIAARIAKEKAIARRSAAACSGVESAVCEDIAKRQQLGIQKYGVTVADNPLPLREWLQHAYEECLDQAVYLKRTISELDRQNGAAQPPKGTP